MTFSYDASTNLLNFEAEVPTDTWLGIGFGRTMVNTDMIALQAYADINKSSINDLWSTKRDASPARDKVDNLLNKTVVANPDRGTQTFKFSRLLDTGDVTNDFIIPVDKAFAMCFAINYK